MQDHYIKPWHMSAEEHLTRQSHWKGFTISFGNFSSLWQTSQCVRLTWTLDSVFVFQLKIKWIVFPQKIYNWPTLIIDHHHHHDECEAVPKTLPPSSSWFFCPSSSSSSVCEAKPRMPPHSLCHPQFSRQHWPGIPIQNICTMYIYIYNCNDGIPIQNIYVYVYSVYYTYVLYNCNDGIPIQNTAILLLIQNSAIMRILQKPKIAITTLTAIQNTEMSEDIEHWNHQILQSLRIANTTMTQNT